MNFANNKRFGHFQPGVHPPYLNFFEEFVTRHLQLYLPCPSGNQFENGIERALWLNKLVGSLNSLYS